MWVLRCSPVKNVSLRLVTQGEKSMDQETQNNTLDKSYVMKEETKIYNSRQLQVSMTQAIVSHKL